MLERKNCRKFYKELRDAMPREAASEKSEKICKQILESTEYKQAQMVFGYYPLGKEVDCLSVLKQALSEGRRAALPRMAGDCQMDFYEIHSIADVEEGAFHVMEPKAHCIRAVVQPAEEKDVLVLVPGVVFDRQGSRYGYGRGFYDRYFARFPELKRVGLAYSEQLSDKVLECLATDVRMNLIVTEKETIKNCKKKI